MQKSSIGNSYAFLNLKCLESLSLDYQAVCVQSCGGSLLCKQSGSESNHKHRQHSTEQGRPVKVSAGCREQTCHRPQHTPASDALKTPRALCKHPPAPLMGQHCILTRNCRRVHYPHPRQFTQLPESCKIPQKSSQSIFSFCF